MGTNWRFNSSGTHNGTTCPIEIQHFESELRALLREEIMTAVQSAGYEEVCWHDPEANGYYQPIVTARNR